jgi:hypothetical protein
MINIGITGQAGFMGTHLYNYLGLKKDDVNRIPFRDEYFSDEKVMEDFVRQCDVIVHLAALNRHNDPDAIYNTNIELVGKLIRAMEHTNSRTHVLFSSSTQEERDNVFGRSKREGRRLLSEWARRNNAVFTGMIAAVHSYAESLLVQNGWRQNGIYFLRPGKQGSKSDVNAVFTTPPGYSIPVFYNFSTKAPVFKANKGYSPVQVIAALSFNSNYKQCISQLKKDFSWLLPTNPYLKKKI